jgi:DNA polymerase
MDVQEDPIVRAWIEDALAFGIEDLFRTSVQPERDSSDDAKEQPTLEPLSQPPRVGAVPHPVRAPFDTAAGLLKVAEEVAVCEQCELCRTRKSTVPGEGNHRARLLFIGEAPGQDEDESGRPFVGKAGQLLTKMIEAMGLAREEVFITNVLKCRPPNNRDPLPLETLKCLPFLRQQFSLIKPELVIALGGHAMRGLLPDSGSVGSMRGRVHPLGSSSLIVTYHPSYLLRDPTKKRLAWDDLKLAMRTLRLSP